jgi:hypothetical protein
LTFVIADGNGARGAELPLDLRGDELSFFGASSNAPAAGCVLGSGVSVSAFFRGWLAFAAASTYCMAGV